MDGFEILVYVIITIIWIIVQNSRRKKLKQQREARQAYEESPEGQKEGRPVQRSVIDEILEEIRQERQQEEADDYLHQPTESAPETIITGQDSLNKKTAEYDDMLADIERKKREKESSRFEAYKTKEDKWATEEEEEENEYASLIFEDPDSPRKAIILSEILNRKHF